MMRETNIQLLDCTLRDGGYINDWNFGRDNLMSIFSRVTEAGVDILEIGFLDERRLFDLNRSIMPDTSCVQEIYGNLDRKNTMIVGMIDYGTCSLEHIQPCRESFLDGIRVIFKKHLRREALAFCKALKKLGYLVFAQLVSVTSYTDDEMRDLISLANDVAPYAVSMVDTYGLMHQNNLLHYLELLNMGLLPEIRIGYHGHNNFQMGYANAIAFLKEGTAMGRGVLVDGSLYGMGKGAGNAPLELLAMHLNNAYGRHYDISQLLEAMDANISAFYGTPAWGYSMHYFLAASNDCHPNYVKYLINKRTLSVRSVNEILGQLQGEKKLLYDNDYIEKLYYDYLDVEIQDDDTIQSLKERIGDRPMLLLGPGNNICLQEERIQSYLTDKNPLVISVNFLPENLPVDVLFVSNAKRFVQLSPRLAEMETPDILATSNVTGTHGPFPYRVSFASLQCGEAEFRDNPFLMLLKVMIRLEIPAVTLAGFDGYVDAFHKNYVDQKMEYHYSDKESREINEAVSGVLREMQKQIGMTFLTDTLYHIN